MQIKFSQFCVIIVVPLARPSVAVMDGSWRLLLSTACGGASSSFCVVTFRMPSISSIASLKFDLPCKSGVNSQSINDMSGATLRGSRKWTLLKLNSVIVISDSFSPDVTISLVNVMQAYPKHNQNCNKQLYIQSPWYRGHLPWFSWRFCS